MVEAAQEGGRGRRLSAAVSVEPLPSPLHPVAGRLQAHSSPAGTCHGGCWLLAYLHETQELDLPQKLRLVGG